MLSGSVASIPPGGNATLVLFRAGTPPAKVFAAIATIDAHVLWTSPAGDLVAIAAPRMTAWQLYSHGALVVGSLPVLGGSLAWARS